MNGLVDMPPFEGTKVLKAVIQVSDLFEYSKLPKLDSIEQQKEILFRHLQENYRGQADKLEITLNGSKVEVLWIVPKAEKEAERFNIEALKFARQHEPASAIEAWKKAIEKNGREPDYHYNMSLAYIELKEYGRAIDACLNTVEICPIYYRAYFVAGSIYLKSRQFDEAISYLRKGLLFQADNLMALINLGAAYSILRRYDDAIHAFERAIAHSPREAKAYLGLAKIYAAQGNIDDANRCFRAVIKLDANGKLGEIAKRSLLVTETADADSSGVRNLEDLYAEGYQSFIKGEFSVAADAYKKYLAQRSADADIWASLSACKLYQGEKEEAIQAMKKAISLQPNKAVFHKQAAIIYDACGLATESGQEAQKAIDLGKHDSVTLSLLGKSLFALGKFQESARHLQDAVKLNPNNLNARFYFAQVLAKLEQKEAAKEHFEEILWSKTDSSLKEKVKVELEKLTKQ